MSTLHHSLNDLIGSRICHDLISPIGAISNGVELISMNSAAAGPELTLISDSVESANAKIRFFRVAFGNAAPGQMIGPGEIRSILADMNRGGRLTFHWQPDGELDRAQVKLAFLLLMCFESAMPWGGQVNIGHVGAQWAINGRADQMKIDPELWAGFVEPFPDITPNASTVHFAMARMVATDLGRELRVESSVAHLRVRF